jgi:hypothetical protein
MLDSTIPDLMIGVAASASTGAAPDLNVPYPDRLMEPLEKSPMGQRNGLIALGRRNTLYAKIGHRASGSLVGMHQKSGQRGEMFCGWTSLLP